MYTWLVNKRMGKVHEISPDGITYCKVENNGEHTRNRLIEPCATYPSHKRLCWICVKVKKDIEFEATHGRLNREYRAIVN